MFGEIYAQFGVAGIVLFICAGIVSVITMERIYFLYIIHSPWKRDVFLDSLLQILTEEKLKPLNIREVHITQELERIDRDYSKGLLLIRFISVIAPMLGLFGTVLGMVHIFGAIAESNAPITPSLISGGLKEALYTTVLGIAIAIPALGANVFFNSVINTRLQKYLYIVNEENINIDYKR
jgi:biopolymer transport protein ExbB/TolQ